MTNSGAARLSVLDEAMITVDHPDETCTQHTLCDVLALLSQGRAIEFAALQAHQQHAWHAFLVQIAAIALQRHSLATVDGRDAAWWRRALLALTGNDAGAWCLVNDWSKAALLQPPVTKAVVEKLLKNQAIASDELDVLFTSKNFDVKGARATAATPELWLFALVTHQTMASYKGKTLYGIARMNSGSGTRVAVGRAPSHSLGARFRRDVAALVTRRDEIVERFGFRDAGGVALLWIEPWDGVAQLARAELDPFFVEICRRIRLSPRGDALVAYSTGSDDNRVVPFVGGRTGDLWSAEGVESILTLSGRGFDYQITQQLLLQADFRCAALEPSEYDGVEPLFVARSLTGGNCKTEGFHERTLPLPTKIRIRLDDAVRKGELAKRSESFVALADRVQRSVLYPSISQLLVGAREKQRVKSKQSKEWTLAFSRAVDRRFFEALFESVELSLATAEEHWKVELLRLGWSHLQQAIDVIPLSASTRWKIVSAAESMYSGCAENQFTGLAWRSTR